MQLEIQRAGLEAEYYLLDSLRRVYGTGRVLFGLKPFIPLRSTR